MSAERYCRLVHWLLLCLLCAAAAQAADPAVRAVDSIGVTVSDLERSLPFYEQVLSFRRESERELAGEEVERLYGVFGLRLRIVRLRLGDDHLELMQFLAPRGRPIPVDSRSNDEWFQHVAIIVSDMSRAYALLREHRVEHASSGPQRLPDWNPDAGGIEAFYFRDPDGHALEILRFPAGKGDPKWQRSDALFLGIDHSAIVVRDTQSSLAFWRDALGLRVAGTSENHGTEQEHLNNVFGARLRITALRAAAGPGVEFLEYLAPRDGRPAPLDTRANDLWHWQINASADIDAAEDALVSARGRMVSPGAVSVGSLRARGLLVRDPSGHAAMLTEPAEQH